MPFVPHTKHDEQFMLESVGVDSIEALFDEKDRKAFEKVSGKAKLTRYGLDCYGYALVAMGTADLVIEAGLSIYDIQAPSCVIQAAGGIVTNWEGKPVDNGGRIIAASNEKLHRNALEQLNS